MVGFCLQGDELSGYIKTGDFFLKEIFYHRVSQLPFDAGLQ
jgi:hypothetical protein